MSELAKVNIQSLLLTTADYWKNENLFLSIERVGFRNVDWTNAPEELLLYIFLHDEQKMGERRTDSTKKEYLRDLNQFLGFIHSNNMGPLQNLHSEQLLEFQRHLEGKYKKTTLKKKSSVVKHFFKYLASKDIIKKDITLQMKLFKTKKEELVNRDLYDDEVKQILEYFKENDWFAYTLFYVLVSSGMRINELATAKWSNLRYVPSAKYYFLTVTGKGNNPRDVIIFDDILEVIIENRKRKSLSIKVGDADGTAFFPKANGKHYNTTYLSNEFTRLVSTVPFDFIQARFKRELESEESGKPIRYRITPHTCRHYTAAYYMDRGVDPTSIQNMLGHSSLLTTERYLRRKRSLENHAGVKLGERNFMNVPKKKIDS
jgi:site-specific recombinase XerD